MGLRDNNSPATEEGFPNGAIGTSLHERLRDAIVSGGLHPGQALSESEIAARYSVSRQPVREAFIRLAQEGLVAVLPQRGTFVLKISIKEVMDARFVREAVEEALVREAALLRPEGLVPSLRALIDAQSKVATGDNASFLTLDEAFHRQIADALGRERVWRVVDQAKAQMDRVRFLSYEAATPSGRLIEQHTAIVDAIEAGDPQAAASALKLHMGEILNSLPVLAERFPGMFQS